MNYGPLVFLAAFAALAASWFGFVLTPHLQIGHLQQTNTVPSGVSYPVARSGLAQQGLQVYRANGCAYCHSQQVAQTGTLFDLVLTNPGTNQASTVAAIQSINPRLSQPEVLEIIGKVPVHLLTMVSKSTAEAAAKTVNATGANAVPWIVPIGPDIQRGWGSRRTVAEDFLFDYPVLPGNQRIGPDLSNVGVRQPDPGWHLRHLYAPASVVPGSTMPPYPFLFEKKKVGRVPSPSALPLSGIATVEDGYEVIPKPEALALAEYLVSLQAYAPLFNAPLSVAAGKPASPTETNSISISGGDKAPSDISMP